MKGSKVVQLRIQLVETEPLVWRRVLVPLDFKLSKLHELIQVVMGWNASHLYEFRFGADQFGPEGNKSDKSIKLTDLIKDECQKFSYIYDFGDHWEHEIIVEKISNADLGFRYPICTGGESACPPDDCGGIPGYNELKEKIARDPRDKERIETMRWLGGFFDPNAFDPNQVNRNFLWHWDWK